MISPIQRGGGGVNCTPNYVKKKLYIYIYIGHRARSRAKDNRSSLPGPLSEQLNNSVFSECACTSSPDDVTLCAVEDARAILRNHLRENVSL